VTVSAWINGTVQNTGGAIKGIACKDDGGAVTQPPYCIFVQTGTVTWTTANSSNAVLNATSGASALVDNTWYHLVGTYDNSLGSNQAKLYINGVVAGNATGSSALAVSTTAFSIGTQKTFFASTRSFAGSIDDVRLWNRALSASEVQTLYNTYR
jgi:hypothetical protein